MKPVCPECMSEDIVYVIRGMPDNKGWRMIYRGIATTTGCCVSGDEKNSRCKKCGHGFDFEWEFDGDGNPV